MNPFLSQTKNPPQQVSNIQKNSTAHKQTGFLRVIQPLSHMIQVDSPYNPIYYITLDRNVHRKNFAKEPSLGHPSRVATDEPLTG